MVWAVGVVVAGVIPNMYEEPALEANPLAVVLLEEVPVVS